MTRRNLRPMDTANEGLVAEAAAAGVVDPVGFKMPNRGTSAEFRKADAIVVDGAGRTHYFDLVEVADSFEWKARA